jgi:hypothetical protein
MLMNSFNIEKNDKKARIQKPPNIANPNAMGGNTDEGETNGYGGLRVLSLLDWMRDLIRS